MPSAFDTTAVPTLMTTRRAFDRFSRSGGTSESLSQARAEPTGNELLPEGVLTMCRTSGAFMRVKWPNPSTRSTSGPGLLPIFKFNILSTTLWPLRPPFFSTRADLSKGVPDACRLISRCPSIAPGGNGAAEGLQQMRALASAPHAQPSCAEVRAVFALPAAGAHILRAGVRAAVPALL